MKHLKKFRTDHPDLEAAFFAEDDFWYQNGRGHYLYQHNKLREARAWSYERIQNAVSGNVNLIIIDNIHLTISEMLPYARLSLSSDYQLSIFQKNLPPPTDLPLLSKRNSHGVKLWILELMRKQWEDVDAETLLRIASDAGNNGRNDANRKTGA